MDTEKTQQEILAGIRCQHGVIKTIPCVECQIPVESTFQKPLVEQY